MFSATSRFKALVAAAALLLTTAPILAGQYVIEKGKGVEVCEAYEKDLNFLSSDVLPPVCGAKLNPKSLDIKTPDWRKWSNAEIWQRRYLAKDMEKSIASMVGGADKDFNDTTFYAKLKADLDKGQYALSLSEAIFKWRNGTQTTYIKREGTCDAVVDYDEPMGRIFFVLDKTASKIALVESTGTTSSQFPFQRPDIVLYKGEPFLQSWASGELEITGMTTATYCKYRYTKPANIGDSK